VTLKAAREAGLGLYAPSHRSLSSSYTRWLETPAFPLERLLAALVVLGRGAQRRVVEGDGAERLPGVCQSLGPLLLEGLVSGVPQAQSCCRHPLRLRRAT
jgi:hypothetical protein